MKKMKILILGANGFIGSNLSEAILTKNQLVYYCNRLAQIN